MSATKEYLTLKWTIEKESPKYNWRGKEKPNPLPWRVVAEFPFWKSIYYTQILGRFATEKEARARASVLAVARLREIKDALKNNQGTVSLPISE